MAYPDPHSSRPPQDPTQVPPEVRARRLKRRYRILLLVKLLALLVVILLAGVLWLQSDSALKHVLLPLASRQLGTPVTAQGGSIHLTGRILLNDFTILGNDGKPALTVDRLAARLDPASLVPGRTPTVEEARLSGAHVRVNAAGAGTNWDFLQTKKKEQPEPKVKKQNSNPAGVNVDRLEATGVTVDYLGADGLTLSAKDAQFIVQGLGRGKTGTFSLKTEAGLKRPAAGIDQAGPISSQGKLTQSVDGKELNWDGALTADMQPQTTGTLAGLAGVKLHATGLGSSRADGSIKQDLTLDAATGHGPAGQITVNIEWDPARGKRQAVLVINGVGRELLNPFLAMLGPLQLTQCAINGQATVRGEANGKVAIDSKLNGRNLAFLRAGADTPTPPVTLDFSNQGTYDPASGELNLSTVALNLEQAGNTVLKTTLSEPLRLNLQQRGGGAATTQVKGLEVTLASLPLEALQPWLTLAGVAMASEFTGGVLNGRMTVDAAQGGDALALVGEVNATGVELSQRPGLVLDITKNFNVKLEEMRRLDLGPTTVQVATEGQPLADLDFDGAFDLKTKTGAGQFKLTLPQALQTARRLGALERLPDGVHDGRLELTPQWSLAADGALTLAGDGRLEGLSLASADGNAPLPVSMQYKITRTAQQLTFDPVSLTFSPGGSAPGQLTVRGEWPTGPNTGAGTLTVKTEHFDLAPWLRLRGADSGALGNVVGGVLPLNADEKLSINNADEHLRVEGEANLGPLTIPAENGEPAARTITLRHEVEKTGTTLQTLVLDLLAQGAGAADKVHLEGSGTIGGDAPMVNLAVQVDALNADPYLALAGAMSGTTAAPAAPTAGAYDANVPPVDEPIPPAAKPNAKKTRVTQGIAATLDLKQVRLKQAELTQAKGSFALEHSVMNLKIDEGKLNGGVLAGTFNADLGRQEPRYAWDLTLKQCPIQPVVSVFKPDWGDRLTGTADLKTKGAGEGTGATLQRRLQGEAAFVIKDGELHNFALLDALTQQTQLDVFKNLQFFEFTGSVALADGVATLRDWVERGKQQMLSMEGTMKLDGPYELVIQPAVASGVAGKFGQDATAQKLLADDKGFLLLPFQVAVSGQGDQYQVAPRVSSGALTKNLEKTAREAISGAVGQQLLQRVGLGQAATTSTQEATTASEPAANAPAVDSPGGALLVPVLKRLEKNTAPAQKAATKAAKPQAATAPATTTAEPATEPTTATTGKKQKPAAVTKMEKNVPSTTTEEKMNPPAATEKEDDKPADTTAKEDEKPADSAKEATDRPTTATEPAKEGEKPSEPAEKSEETTQTEKDS